MKETYPNSIESIDSCRIRCNAFKKDLRNHLSNNLGHKNIGLIGHNAQFRVLTTKPEFWERFKDEKLPSKIMPDALDCLSLKNCEFALFQL